jgi:hypothetical protein
MTRKIILAAAFVFATVSAAFAQGPVFETIYNPNAPGLTAQPEGPLNNPLLDDGGRGEEQHLNHPLNRIFGNVFFGPPEDHAN